MAQLNFKANFHGYSVLFEEHGESRKEYRGYSKDSVIRQVKHDANNMYADEFSIYCNSKNSNIYVGSWERKGDKWYKM